MNACIRSKSRLSTFRIQTAKHVFETTKEHFVCSRLCELGHNIIINVVPVYVFCCIAVLGATPRLLVAAQCARRPGGFDALVG